MRNGQPFNETYLLVDEIEMVVQVNGKVRARFMANFDEEEETVKKTSACDR